MKRHSLEVACRNQFGERRRRRGVEGASTGGRVLCGGTNVREFAGVLGLPFDPDPDGSAAPCPLSPEELQQLREEVQGRGT